MVIILEPPGVPKIATPLSDSINVGVMLDNILLFGSMEFCSPWTNPYLFGVKGFAEKYLDPKKCTLNLIAYWLLFTYWLQQNTCTYMTVRMNYNGDFDTTTTTTTG